VGIQVTIIGGGWFSFDPSPLGWRAYTVVCMRYHESRRENEFQNFDIPEIWPLEMKFEMGLALKS
jgi:hypothetical protein